MWCSHLGDHLHEELVKFGYSSERKVNRGESRIILKSCYILGPAKTRDLIFLWGGNLATWQQFLNFFQWKFDLFCPKKNWRGIFCKKFWNQKNELKKKTHWLEPVFLFFIFVMSKFYWILPPKLQNWLKLHSKNIFLQNFLEFLVKEKSENLLL